ncbi:hypothetical protein FZC84_11975 [Rossellomorea vietnamensis]|uniref:Uncharacterized protein n=1 Tax=Rossellomorea vietnamensis TaxID=218284 RepID=A0A5D4MCB4_9BACI|nr:hypothetical protein [Rossellomorea vietnamensis]TYR99087.1 hypothetical protein FZC84_11975 [Rossellomorea vietnamensis]
MILMLITFMVPIIIIGYVSLDINKKNSDILDYYMKHKENYVITLFVLLISIILLSFQAGFANLDREFWLSFIPNLITDLVGIIIAVFIINIILNRRQERQEKAKTYRMMGNRYEQLIIQMVKLYISAISRKPFVTGREEITITKIKSMLEETIGDINFQIDENFFTKPIEVLIFHENMTTNNVFDKFRDHYVDRIDFTEYIKREIQGSLDNFINRYISILPQDLKELLFSLEDLTSGNMFLNPKKLNPQMNPSNINFDPEVFRNFYRDFGEVLMLLLTYFEDEQY